MIHHSSVSLGYLEAQLQADRSAFLRPGEGAEVGEATLTRQRGKVAHWRSQGYTYAPPCDNIRPDGHCAGHEKE